jgi:hypothetical protein
VPGAAVREGVIGGVVTAGRARAARLRAVAAVLVLAAAGCSSGLPKPPPPSRPSGAVAAHSSPATTRNSASTPRRPTTPVSSAGTAADPPGVAGALPRGGQQLLPKWRVVAYYGGSNGPALGVLGSGPPDAVWPRLDREAARWSSAGHPVLPAFELIAVVADAGPGLDGRYRTRISGRDIDRYLAAARRHKALLVLDIQPGRSDFPTEARRLERWLREPDVALAIDPEWRMGPGEVPGRKIGSVQAAEVNAVSGWLDALTARLRLPQKLLLVHQFTTNMVRGKPAVRPRPHLAMVFNMDGFGGQEAKLAKYRLLAADHRFGLGFKLFYKQDVDLFQPRELLAVKPAPSMIEYQ